MSTMKSTFFSILVLLLSISIVNGMNGCNITARITSILSEPSSVTCSGKINSCNRSVTLPTPFCGKTTVKYSYDFCNYETLPLTIQKGVCNSTLDGYNRTSCTFAYLNNSTIVPMNFASPMTAKTCRPYNFTTTISTCFPTPSQIQVQGYLSDQTFCRTYVFLRVNWLPDDPTLGPSKRPTKKPSRKPTSSPTKKPTKAPSPKPQPVPYGKGGKGSV